MKYSILVTVLLFSIGGMLFTGFQCGSADVTSAKLYEQRGDLANAEKSYVKEVTKNPNNAEAWYLLGHVRALMSNYSGMMEAFDKCLALPEGQKYASDIANVKKAAWGQSLNNAVGLYNRSITAPADSAVGLRNKAIEQYKIALQINPDSAMTYQNLAIAYHANKDYADEIAALKQGLQRNNSIDLQTSLINAYITDAAGAEANKDTAKAQADYNAAIAAMTDARKLKPNDPELLKTMIDLYVRTGRAKEAMPLMQEAINNAAPGDTVTKVYQYDMGVLLLQTDDFPGAIEHFDAALKIDPNYEPALQNMAVAHMKYGDKLKKAAQESESKDKSYIQHFKDATKYFEQLINLNDKNKENPDYWDYLASAYANANMVKQAKEAIAKADELRKK